jgi:hypothetical protein
LPSSSSHALFGGLMGATWVAAGAGAVRFGTVVSKVLIPAVLAPIIAGVIALVGTYLAYRITARADRGTVSSGFKVGQVVSASMVSLAHGTNDAQKTMGIITLTLITAGTLPAGSAPPFWVILTAGLAIALGTYSMPAAPAAGYVGDEGPFGAARDVGPGVAKGTVSVATSDVAVVDLGHVLKPRAAASPRNPLGKL